MAANFLHGVETVVVNSGPVPVRVVKSGVIALVGTAPSDNTNELILVSSPVDAAQFGSAKIPGFTIPKSLEAIFAQGAGSVLVVNVASSDNLDNIAAETKSVAAGSNKVKLDEFPMVINSIENQATETLDVNTHYTINDIGEVVLTNRALVGVSEVKASATVTITGGTSSAGVNKVTQISVNGVNLLSGAVDWVTSHAATAAAVAANATAHTSSPEYSVSAVGANIVIIALAGTGSTTNGFDVVVTVGGDVTTSGNTELTGGVDAETATTAITVDYDYFDASSVTASEVIGEVSGGDRTGLELFDLAYNTFGFTPKLFIAPEFSQLTAVQSAMLVKAAKFRAKAFIDGQEGWTPAQAIADRGPAGGVFNTSSPNAVLCYPKVKRYDAYTDNDELFPSSVYWAGVTAATDIQLGYWNSPSNKNIKGITGVERLVTFAVNDATSEANQLNEVGICTIVNAFGTGFRTWGNRTADYPASTGITTFIAVDRTANIIDESLELATLQFIDRPLNQPTIDSIRDTGNAFIRTLVSRGALIDGLVTYDPAKNPSVQLAAGQILFDVTYLPPGVTERITYERFIDINFFNNLA